MRWWGGVNDLTDTGILDKKIVSESGSNIYITSGVNNSLSLTCNNFILFFGCVSTALYAVYFYRGGTTIATLTSEGSAISASGESNTFTVTNSNSNVSMRYIAIVN